MQIVSNRDSLHELSNPVSWEKLEKCHQSVPREWWRLALTYSLPVVKLGNDSLVAAYVFAENERRQFTWNVKPCFLEEERKIFTTLSAGI